MENVNSRINLIFVDALHP